MPLAGDEGEAPPAGIVHEAFADGSVLLLVGSILLAAVVEPAALSRPFAFVHEIFMGVPCRFPPEMGMEAGRRIDAFRRVGLYLVGLGIRMPLPGGAVGTPAGNEAPGFGLGGTLPVAVPAAGASCMTVPPAMRLAVPEAKPSLYLTLSPGVTFPSNVVVAIPVCHGLAERILA